MMMMMMMMMMTIFQAKDQSAVAQRAKTTVNERSLTSRVWARFPKGSYTIMSSLVSPLRLRVDLDCYHDKRYSIVSGDDIAASLV